jgi:hypothetical protein
MAPLNRRDVLRTRLWHEQAPEHPAAQLEGLGEDEPRAVAVRRLPAPRLDLFLRPEEVQTRSEEAGTPVATPPSLLDPRQDAGRRPAGTADGMDLEVERRTAPVTS